MRRVAVELAEQAKERIEVWFSYSPEYVRLMKHIPGHKFVSAEKSYNNAAHWTVPLDLVTCRSLRKQFGDALVIGPSLKAWARREVQRHDQMRELSRALDGDLKRLPDVNPELAEWLHPYQRGGTVFIAHGDNVLIADQAGLGKTAQVIAAILEAGKEPGIHLVISPKSAMESVWERELSRWSDAPVFVAPEGPAKIAAMLQEFTEQLEWERNGWMIVRQSMVALQSTFDTSECETHDVDDSRVPDMRKCAKAKSGCEETKITPWPLIHDLDWDTVVNDEVHRGNIRNPKTMTAQGVYKLNANKRIAMSGTPMTNRMIDLWGTLHWLNPKEFSSKWRWAEQWCEVEEDTYYVRGGKGKTAKSKKIGGLRDDVRDEFYAHLAPYILRRTKQEVAPQLPPKQINDVWVDLTPGTDQHRQYRQMADDAEVRIAEEYMTATSILAEFTRLKQFAVAAQEIHSDKLKPTSKSVKLDKLMELLDERGIRGELPEGNEKVVVFSQFAEVAALVHEHLMSQGIDVLIMTGKTTRKGERLHIQDEFQSDGGPRVLVMTTTTGGVSITLDRADTVIFMDETWSPSDMEQAEDRVHRISRVHQVMVYYIRTRGTIDEYIMDIVDDKGKLHKEVLDTHRIQLKA